MLQPVKIVTVVNDFDIFNKVIKENKFIKDFDLTVFDNTQENIGIPERYNSFINNNIKPDSDFWVIFCHQDFGFYENPLPILNKLDKNFIYGVIGSKILNCLKKTKLFNKEFILNANKIVTIGEINQGYNDFNFLKIGKKFNKPETVTTIDCCCIILHSSLINKYNLRFDENLKFHMYAEDLCMNIHENYYIKTKVVQFECFHLGKGTFNEEFHNAVKYIRTKYKISRIICTTANYHNIYLSQGLCKYLRKILCKILLIPRINKLFRTLSWLLQECA